MNQDAQELILKVTPDKFNTIMAALEELPHKISRKLIDDLSEQIRNQVDKLQQEQR